MPTFVPRPRRDVESGQSAPDEWWPGSDPQASRPGPGQEGGEPTPAKTGAERPGLDAACARVRGDAGAWLEELGGRARKLEERLSKIAGEIGREG